MADKKIHRDRMPDRKLESVIVDALPAGGFLIRETGKRDFLNLEIAAFSTLPETLAWLGRNIGAPVKAPTEKL